jgi:hypothetical protein
MKEALQGLEPSGLEPPWPATETTHEARLRRGLFEGDAAIELRVRLAQTRGGSLPPSPGNAARGAWGAVVRYIGAVMTASAVAGAAGYVVGGLTRTGKPARISLPWGDTWMPPSALFTRAVYRDRDLARRPACAGGGGYCRGDHRRASDGRRRGSAEAGAVIRVAAAASSG